MHPSLHSTFVGTLSRIPLWRCGEHTLLLVADVAVVVDVFVVLEKVPFSVVPVSALVVVVVVVVVDEQVVEQV